MRSECGLGEASGVICAGGNDELPVPTDGVAFFPLNHFPPSGSVDLLEFAYDAPGVEGLGAAMLRDDGNGEVVCYFIEHEWTDEEKRYHINIKEGVAGYAALTSLYPIAPHRHALAHGDNTTETITSATNKSRSAMQSAVLQHRADFAGRTGVVTRLRRVKSKDNVLADPISRLATDTFKSEARKLGATRFVKIPLAPEVGRLLDELAERLVELEEDGDPTSGTAATVEEVYRREEDFARREAAAAAKTAEAEQHAGASAPWGFVSGFCGADSMSFAVEPLGGLPLAGFDADELVRRLWEERTGIRCWGAFQGVFDAALDGHLDWLAPATLVYVSGSPCPDFSKAGNRRGVGGVTGGLWLDDCDLGCRLRPPILIREMVTGIFDVDGGSAFWAAVGKYRDAGYVVGWAVRMARRHGDPTSRRRVFLVAVRPELYRRREGRGGSVRCRGDLARLGGGGELPRRRTRRRFGVPRRRRVATGARHDRLRRPSSCRHDRHRRHGVVCLRFGGTGSGDEDLGSRAWRRHGALSG